MAGMVWASAWRKTEVVEQRCIENKDPAPFDPAKVCGPHPAEPPLLLYHDWGTIEKVTLGRSSDDEEGESPGDSARV